MPKMARFLILLLLVGGIGGGIWFYKHRESPSDPTQLTLYGNVDIREVQPAFNASGRITSLAVQEGARVKQGELLATLDSSRYTAALNQATAALAAAKVTYQNNAVIYRRYTQLATTNATAIQQRDDARAAYQAAYATYQAQQAAVALAQRQLDDTRLYAPADGIVENRILEPGDMASPSTPVYTIALLSPTWVRAYVPETAMGRIRTGMRAAVSTDSFPNHRYEGWIGYISPTAEFTPKTVQTPALRTALVFEVRVYVCDTRDELRLGMPATVHIDTQPSTPAQPPKCGPVDAKRAP
ncbi:efflux RND transporter periplasmic adaptor subunit [Mangrovitalea sediminis]|uniref:efflux RND transporter periplasmic adaptor subunit n=1 Tax=Mangrovitalea sediminis TaxID=1982043 RepID=UPI0018E98A22|nr:efflux RND transporter periplasmic adaptor subunit [Mangrovitalea sediminis]